MNRLFRCYRCNPPFGVEFESAEPVCPLCKAQYPAIVQLTQVHWLKQADGAPIRGFEGRGFYCACDPSRVHLAGVPDAHNHSQWAASDSPDAVSCVRCKKDPDYLRSLAIFMERNRRPNSPPLDSKLAAALTTVG